MRKDKDTPEKEEALPTRYGYSSSDWNAAKKEMRQILIDRAKVRRDISYSELASKMQTIQLEPNSYALAELLGEISTEENSLGRGMLSVIVVHKTGDKQPGKGFFELANELGRDISDIDTCWIDELKRVYADWSV